MVAGGFAIANHPAAFVSEGADEFELAWDDRPGEVTFADEIRNDVDVPTVYHPEDVTERWFFFPEATDDLVEQPSPPDFFRMHEGRGARVRIERRAMAGDDESGVGMTIHSIRAAQTFAASKYFSAYARAARE
jgi:hypothetical protein